MPRQHTRHRRAVLTFPDDFPERLEWLKETSGLSWSELARRLGTEPLTLRRWRAGARPNSQHLLALMGLSEDMRCGHLLHAGEGNRG